MRQLMTYFLGPAEQRPEDKGDFLRNNDFVSDM